MKIASIVIVTSCLSISPFLARYAAVPAAPLSQDKRSTAPKAGVVTGQPPRPVGKPIVREISALVLDKKTKGQGLVKVSGASEGCSPTSFEGQIAVEPDFGARGPTAFIALLFLQGVRHEIHGEVCWPSPDLEFRIEGKMGGESVTKDGQWVSTGRINAKGTITISGANDPATETRAKVFRIWSSSSRPLVFAVSAAGYRYLSGEGTMTTPTGRIFRFTGR